jgi:hypothetical protein
MPVSFCDLLMVFGPMGTTHVLTCTSARANSSTHRSGGSGRPFLPTGVLPRSHLLRIENFGTPPALQISFWHGRQHVAHSSPASSWCRPSDQTYLSLRGPSTEHVVTVHTLM